MSWPTNVIGMGLFNHHDVTEEDIRAAEWGEDYDFWADVERTENLNHTIRVRNRVGGKK